MPTIILTIFLLVALVVTALYAFGLLYHWIRFGWLYPWVWVAMPVYLVGCGFFILLMLGAMAVS